MPEAHYNIPAGQLLAQERRAIAALSAIFALRMFGLFMLLPLLAIYAPTLDGNRPFLAGLALGAYGLTQALLQIPLGILSDRISRKAVIAFGLVVFVMGSVVAAVADSIYGLILGRAIQGAGAVSAVIMALTADLTRGYQRPKAMAIIGMTIGASFLLAMVVGPALQARIGVAGLFFTIALLGVGAIGVLYRLVPTPPTVPSARVPYTPLGSLARVVGDGHLVQLNGGIFVSHAVLTALFLVVPGQLINSAGIPLSEHWKWYVLILAASIPGLLVFMALARGRRMVRAYRLAVTLLAITLVVAAVAPPANRWQIILFMIAFFSAFNALETLLPSLMSRLASPRMRGAASSVYSTFQFAGVFVGGALGGWVWGQYGTPGVYLMCLVLVAGWFTVVWAGSRFVLRQSVHVDLSPAEPSRRTELIARIRRLNGVEEVVVVAGEVGVYLEVDGRAYRETELRQLLGTDGILAWHEGEK